jgi:Tol biopolymer transport system component
MNKQRALFVILLLGISACTSRKVSSSQTPEPTSTLVTIITVAPTATVTPTTIMTPTVKPTELPSPTHLPTKSPTPTALLQLSGPYLGQEPPGMEPEVFAPGYISSPGFSEYSGSFSPDGDEYYFFRYSPNTESVLLLSKVDDGKWSFPEQLAVTAEYVAFEPYVTLDNRRLYFMWGYPVPPGQPEFPYFFIERTSDGWSEPIFAGQGMFLSSTQDGQLYTTDMSSRSVDGKTFLAKITLTDGVFTDYERLNIETPWGNPAHPCIALDGSYILFDVGSGNHLFVSFKNADGTWGEPIDLTKHGFNRMAGGAYISPDGKYLFFSLNKDIWWVDIKVIENLRPSE